VALALYRKYRPATFAEVVGQEHVTEPLQQALASGRINHAYLFSGPRGCGKTSSARILARSLNCENGPTPTPCGTCDSCVALAPDGPGSLDVIEIDAASHGGVDDARDLRERAFFAPVSSRYKVYIIDEAHMVSSQGFNALLKLVEEPPGFLVFVFATTEPDKVLPTIKSRTHHYPFRLIPPGTLRGLMERICAEEGATVEAPVFPLVVRAGNGSARDSLSVLDQLLAGAGPGGVSYRHAVALLGVTDAALLDAMIDALAARDGAAVFQTVDGVVEAGHDPRRFAGDLLERLRDLLVLDAVPDAVAKGLLDGPADQIDRMVDQARRLGAGTLSRLADIVHNGLVDMRGTTAPRLLLELVCARMLLPSAEADAGALLQRLERLERRADIVGAAPPMAERPSGDRSAGDRVGGDRAGAERPGAGPSRGERPGAEQSRTERAAAPSAASRTGGSAAPAAEDTADLVRETLSQRRPAGQPPAPRQPAGAPSAEPARTQPARTQPARTQPARTQPARTQPARTEPAPTQPPGTEPARTQPRSQSARTEPAPTQPPGSEPAGTGSHPEPPRAEPQPGTTKPDTPAGGIDAAAVRRVWPEVLEMIKRRRRTHALLLNAVVSAVDGDTLVLAMSTAPLARLLSEDSNLEHIRTALRDILGVDWKVRVEVANGSDGGPVPAAPGVVRDDDPRDEMSAEDPPPAAARRDPERDALSLLQSTLGAQQIDDGP